MERRHQRIAAFVLALLVPAAGAASGEPVIVMSGHLTSVATSSVAEFRLAGTDGFELAGSWPGFSIPCDCRIGGTLDASSRFAYEQVPFVWGDPFAFARGVVGGQRVAGFLSGALVFAKGDWHPLIPAVPVPFSCGILRNAERISNWDCGMRKQCGMQEGLKAFGPRATR